MSKRDKTKEKLKEKIKRLKDEVVFHQKDAALWQSEFNDIKEYYENLMDHVRKKVLKLQETHNDENDEPNSSQGPEFTETEMFEMLSLSHKIGEKLEEDDRHMEDLNDVLSSKGYYLEFPIGEPVTIERADIEIPAGSLENIDTSKSMVVDHVIRPTFKFKNRNKEIKTITPGKITVKNK